MASMIFNKQQMQWATDHEDRSLSVFSDLIMKVYKLKTLRPFCLRLVNKLESGPFFSKTLRRIFYDFYGVQIGSYSYGSCFVPGLFPKGTEIGAYCSIASGLKVFRRNHPLHTVTQHPFFYNHILGLVANDAINTNEENPLSIGNDVWIGDSVLIMANCKSIGDGAIVGAGSVVTKNVEPYTVIAGNPARVIKKRFDDETICKIMSTKWWTLTLPELLRTDYVFTILTNRMS